MERTYQIEKAAYWNRKLAQDYDLPDYAPAKKALVRIQRELTEANSSAARSLAERQFRRIVGYRLTCSNCSVRQEQ